MSRDTTSKPNNKNKTHRYSMTYLEAVEYVRRRGFKSRSQYWKWWDESKPKPPVPKLPDKAYKAEWESWGAYLGTNNVYRGSTPQRTYRPFWEAVRWAQRAACENNLTTSSAWIEWYIANSDKIPADIPKRPYHAYKEFTGSGWTTWLGLTLNARKKLDLNTVRLCALHHLTGEPANIFILKVWNGASELRASYTRSKSIEPPILVWEYNQSQADDVEKCLKRHAINEDGVWLIQNYHNLRWDLTMDCQITVIQI